MTAPSTRFGTLGCGRGGSLKGGTEGCIRGGDVGLIRGWIHIIDMCSIEFRSLSVVSVSAVLQSAINQPLYERYSYTDSLPFPILGYLTTMVMILPSFTNIACAKS